MKRISFIYIVLVSVLCMTFLNSHSQVVPQGFDYQTTIRNGSGAPLASQPVQIKFSFYSGSASGTLQWEETQAVTTDINAHIHLIIGTGITTGGGAKSSFDQIDWTSGVYYLKIAVDYSGGSSFVNMGSTQLFSVPYSLYSKSAGNLANVGLINFNDVDLSGIANGKVLKWNGSFWSPSADNHSDTVAYSYNSAHSNNADTAYNVFSSTTADSVLFAYQTVNTLSSFLSQNSINANFSDYADTVVYAYAIALSSWRRPGNSIGITPKYLGTSDPVDMAFRTNNLLRLKLKVNGDVLFANTTNAASLSSNGTDGLVEAGTFGSGMLSNPGTGTRMTWLPSKGSFRIGTLDTAFWGDSLGVYSFASGYNMKVGKYSAVSGSECIGGDYTVAMGRKCQATARGAYPNGTGIALGDSCTASAQRTIAIGRGNQSSTFTNAVSIGTFNKASGSVSLALGAYSNANGFYSTVIGYHGCANTKIAGFLYADASSSVITNATANNQFFVRASGGTVFYTDSLCTMGVTLFPGSGSWASVSDKNKKENFSNVNYEEVLSKIGLLKIKEWNYKSQSKAIIHVGPMAQDFYKRFGLGETNTTITGSDMDGIIISGIKALNFRIIDLESLNEMDQLKDRINKLDDDHLSTRLDAIEAALLYKK